MNDSPFLTISDIAKELQIHEVTVYRLAKNKQIPAFKVGGQWRIHRETFNEFTKNGHK